MIARLLPLLAPLLLSACMVQPYLDAPPASEFAPLDLPDATFATPEAVTAHFVTPQVLAGPNVTRAIGRDPYHVGARLMLVTASGYEDDSVLGEQWRITLGLDESGYRVIAAGIRYNCARGETPGWSNQLCP